MTKNQESLSNCKRNHDLATRILEQLGEAMCIKLKELKPELIELRGYFQEKGRDRNILGCETWASFCAEKLHHTKRAVNMMLAESPKWEETSQPEPAPADAEGDSDAGVKEGNDDSCQPTASPLSAGENESNAEIIAQNRAADLAERRRAKDEKLARKLKTLFPPLDSVGSLEEKLTAMLQKLMPVRRFKITIEEIAVESVPVPPVGPDEQGSSSLLKVLSSGEPGGEDVLAENAVRGCHYIYAPAGQAGEYSPLAANPYKGCGHKCSYCYVPQVLKMSRAEFDKGAVPRPDYLANITTDAIKYQQAGKADQQVMLSFTTDPYHLGDTTLTRQVIEVLQAHGMAVCTLTKGGTRALRDLDLFRPKRDAFASTLTSLDDAFSLKWEKEAALPGDRIKALKAFHEAGIFTWVSLEPTLDVESSLAIVKACHKFVDLFKIGRINYDKMTKTTDWKSYTETMIALCAKLKVAHYVKKDLQMWLPAGYVNTVRVGQHN